MLSLAQVNDTLFQVSSQAFLLTFAKVCYLCERSTKMYEVFEQLLQKYGITPYKVAKESGVTQTALSNWKSGKSTPATKTLQKIADYFGVTLDYLLTGQEDPKEKNNPYEAQDDTERQLLILCRKAGDVPKEEKEAILRNFEATMDMYLRAKGIKKE